MSTISVDDYFGPWSEHEDATAEMRANAAALLGKVDLLLTAAAAGGVHVGVNKATGTCVSGSGNGGFRPKGSPVGAKNSSHKEARGVDVYDPDRALAKWCWLNTHRLTAAGLYMEHPQATPGWCHLTDRPPPSGKTVFWP